MTSATVASTGTSPAPDGIAGWAMGLMDALGAPGAGLIVALEHVFPPLPSEVILPLAGFSAGKGRMALWEVLVWTTLGAVAGALVLYGLGALLGRERIHALAAKVPLVKPSDVEKAEDWFDRHGRRTVLFGRMVPVIRSLISVPAGLERMPLATFCALTAIGSLVWNTLLVVAGYLLGDNWSRVEQYVGTGTNILLGLAAAAILLWAGRRVAENRRSSSGDGNSPAPDGDRNSTTSGKPS
ncbi:DedA family protein [Nonomuraea sp. SMC257]|uniref:DedA family protein n=1 Tax=Nonomuraea montanisoli TaxID=2741721 RepID=A0A7Y6I9R7_9ACTN|nr:DedA family protein [Nonomuraea montanisoli]NUW34287.1 DedA family protein [Nonomuraea montanisoli]